ncbi:MAG: antitoxin [Ruaniaceae bacterium]|nr:antitoxin [Ruaniaceae bacterium]
MPVDDLVNKGKDALEANKDKVDELVQKGKDALANAQTEAGSDDLLDKAAAFANKVTGDKFADKVNDARDAIDEKIGDE